MAWPDRKDDDSKSRTSRSRICRRGHVRVRSLLVDARISLSRKSRSISPASLASLTLQMLPLQPDEHGLIFLNNRYQPDMIIGGKNTQCENGNEEIILSITLRIHLALPLHDVTTPHALRSNQPSSCSEANRGQRRQVRPLRAC